MLRAKVRAASLTAVVLFALLAVYPAIFFLQTYAQEPAKLDDKAPHFWIDRISKNQYYAGVSLGVQDRKLKELQQERLMTARELVKQETARFQNGLGLVDEVLESTRTLADAELEVCESNKERVAALEKILAIVKDTERIAAGSAQKGLRPQSGALRAKAERLRVEIALERAKAKKDGPHKGVANVEPDAKVGKGEQKKGTTQPATIEAHESARVFAQVSGVLKKQTVDIGDRVKSGQVLAALDAADLEAQIRHDSAAANQARSRVQQAKARLDGAQADLNITELAVKQAEEAAKSASSSVRFRALQLKRMEDLFKAKGIEASLLDESKERHAAAVGAEQAAKAAVVTAKAQVLASMSKIEQAKADLAAMESGFLVAKGNLDKAQAHLSLATIRAPFDGIITQRGYAPGDLIRSADKRNDDAPLVTIQRTDFMRVIVSIPERDVPFVSVGDAAELEIDALPGKKWSAKVSRVAGALDPKTRTMTVEIDLPNPTGQIRSGMYGRATILFANGKE
jgi:multidrug resistance efflux pump